MASDLPPEPSAVRPLVLALAPPAPGIASGARIPCLARLGDRLLIERLVDTLVGAALLPPIVVAPASAVTELTAVLAQRALVLGAADADRRGALRAALDRTEEDVLLVHDAERSLTPASTIADCLGELTADVDAVVPVIAMTDSVKEVRPDGLRNVDRSTLASLQSPRVLRRRTLEQVLAVPAAGTQAPADGDPRFDEIRAALDLGARVRTVPGSHSGLALVDRLSLWQAQIALGLARDTSHRHGLFRRS